MPNVNAKVTTWSIERMHRWFPGSSASVKSNAAVGEQIDRVANAIDDIAPHILCIQVGKLIREYIQNHPFESAVAEQAIVVGDRNGGPGIDFFENTFFGLDILRCVTGDIGHPERLLTNAIDDSGNLSSAVFFDDLDKQLRKVPLVHILFHHNSSAAPSVPTPVPSESTKSNSSHTTTRTGQSEKNQNANRIQAITGRLRSWSDSN